MIYCEVARCHEKLGTLMSRKIRDDNSRRTLPLNVVARELSDKKHYEWITELKTEHEQLTFEHFGGEVIWQKLKDLEL